MLHMILAHWYVVARQHDDIIIYDIDRNLEGPLICFVAQLFIAKGILLILCFIARLGIFTLMTLSLSKKIKNKNLADKHKWYNHLLVRHSMVPPEETCSDKVGHNHIHSVVVMGKKDADYSHCTQSPAKPVIPPESLWRIYQKERGKKKGQYTRKNKPYTKKLFSPPMNSNSCISWY